MGQERYFIPTQERQSVLATRNWYKFRIIENAVYKITYSQFKKMGINPDQLDPRHIAIYGNGGVILPQPNKTLREADLFENAIWVSGEEDGIFNQSDFIVFYAEGADELNFNAATENFTFQNHDYHDYNYYYLTVKNEQGKRITERPDEGAFDNVVTSFDHCIAYEKDLNNILNSGREWFGERFEQENELTRSFSNPVNSLIAHSVIKFNFSFITQSYSSTNFEMAFKNELRSIDVPALAPIDYGIKAKYVKGSMSKISSGLESNLDFSVTFTPKVSPDGKFGRQQSRMFLDFYTIQTERELKPYGSSTLFRSSKAKHTASRYRITEANGSFQVWDISDPLLPQNQSYTLRNTYLEFGRNESDPSEFVLFNPDSLSSPDFVGQIDNQNIHGQRVPGLIIISHPNYLSQANRLANHRSSHSGMEVLVLTPDHIYNEFSSGKKDFTAVRDMARYFYYRDKLALNSILFFGKSSYDPKNILGKDLDVIPIYLSRNSYDNLYSYSSDDYFGLLEEDEGVWLETFEVGSLSYEDMEIAVGRLPAASITDATTMVDKIIHYETSPACLGSWRKDIVFVGDDLDADKDAFSHSRDANSLASYIDESHSFFNTKRLFLDSYVQIPRAYNQVSPEMQKALVEEIEQGSLIVNFSGHGNSIKWMDESIFNLEEINSLKNLNKLSLFVTATCEFGRHDMPYIISAAEQLMLNPNGGAIALLTTSRPVAASTNLRINKAFYRNVFSKKDNRFLTLGEVTRLTKNDPENLRTRSANRNFTLIGDPSMKLAYPEFLIDIKEITSDKNTKRDTLSATDQISIYGRILNIDSTLINNFKGILEFEVYDKVTKNVTLMQGDNPRLEYNEWDNLLFKGKYEVKNGVFRATFRIPKNINYQLGIGKISLYANNNNVDAGGTLTPLVGGFIDLNSSDKNGPRIDAYLHDESFLNGGLSVENTVFYARLSDESGINLSSFIPSQRMKLTIDDSYTYYVSDYYEADLNTYQSGKLLFPLKSLSVGNHTATFDVWDNLNNHSSEKIRFNVVGGNNLVLHNLANFPNPALNETSFTFEHNRPGNNLEVSIEIFNHLGVLVNKIEEEIEKASVRVNSIRWAGKSIASASGGMYFYKINVRSLQDNANTSAQGKIILAR